MTYACSGSNQPADITEHWEEWYIAQCPYCGWRFMTMMDEPVTAPHRRLLNGDVIVGGVV